MPLLPVSDIFAFPVLLKVLHRQTFNGVSGIHTGNIGISDRKLEKKMLWQNHKKWTFEKFQNGLIVRIFI